MSEFVSDFDAVDTAKVYSTSRLSGIADQQSQVIKDLLKRFKNVDDALYGSLLDIGCGAGNVTRILATSFEESIGVDISGSQISLARNAAGPRRITFKAGVAESLPVADGTIDVVTAVFALHFIKCDEFLIECARVLKPGGIALFYVELLSRVGLLVRGSDTITDTAPLVNQMNDKLSELAKRLKHPQRHVLDCYEALYNDMKWPGKQRVETEIENTSSLADFRRYCLSVPFCRRLGNTEENPVIEFVESVKRLCSMEDTREEDIEVRVRYSAVTIVLLK